MRELSERTQSYLDRVEERIGLLDRASTEAGPANTLLEKEDIEHEQVATHDLGSAVGQGKVQAEVYQYESPNGNGTLFVATWGLRVDIDAVVFPILTFEQKPSLEDIQTAELVRDARWELGRKVQETYRCWECGQETHWLDSEVQGQNSLDERLDRARDQYCGC